MNFLMNQIEAYDNPIINPMQIPNDLKNVIKNITASLSSSLIFIKNILYIIIYI